jgi:hypothetical protein
MGSEVSLWKTVSRNMRGKWIAQRVENAVGPGTPDVYYTMNNGAMGWIENKHAHTWPKRKTTPLKLDHFTIQQRKWIERHGKAGATVYVLLQVRSEYFLLDYEESRNIGEWTKRDYRIHSNYYWYSRIDYNELEQILSHGGKHGR